MSFARFVIVFVLLIAADFAMAAPGPRVGDLECRQVGSGWQMWNKLSGHEIGTWTGDGFPNEGACEWAIHEAVNAGTNVVCAWNASGYTPYYMPTNHSVGEEDIAWRFLRDCIDVVAKNANGKICSYTGQHWMSYDIKTNARQCDDDDGYATQDECLSEIHGTPVPRNPEPIPQPQPQPRPEPSCEMSCQWNGYSWQPWNQTVGFVGLARYGFAYQPDCQHTLDMSHSNAVCNWDGTGFRAYDIRTNATLTQLSYGSLETCYAQVH